MTAKKEWPVKELEIPKIRIDGGTQMRAKIDQDTVNEYRDVWKSDGEFPPLVVYSDGADLWLAGGFHRYHGAKAAGLEKVKCEVRDGTLMDAILFAVGDNRDHGLKRTNADKHKAVHFLLTHPEWSKKSDRAIADAAGVSHNFVSDLRKQLTAKQLSSDDSSKPQPTRTGKDGKERPASSKPKPGKQKPKEPEPEPPSPEPVDVSLDLIGNELPEHLIASAQDTWTEETVQVLDEIMRDILARCNKRGGNWLLRKIVTDNLKVARQHINDAAFHAICPDCNGAKKGCDQCRHNGWVPEWRYTEMTSGVR